MENLLKVNFKGRYFKNIIQEIAHPFTFLGCCKLDLVLNITVASNKEKKPNQEKAKNQKWNKKTKQQQTPKQKQTRNPPKNPNPKNPQKWKKGKKPSYWDFNSGDIPAWATMSHTYLIILNHIEGKKSIVVMVHMT